MNRFNSVILYLYTVLQECILRKVIVLIYSNKVLFVDGGVPGLQQ